MGNKKQALLSYKKAEKFISKIKDGYLISLIYEYLGVINSENGLLDRAKPYYQKSLKQALQLKQYNLIIANLGHIGMDYLRVNQIDSAMIYYEEALEYLPHLSDNERAGVYHNLGAFYLLNVKSKRQIGDSFLKKAIQLADASNKLRTYVILANYYVENGQYELADSLWSKSMETNDGFVRSCIYNARFQYCEQVGDYKSALTFLKKYYTLTDSLSALNRSKSIAEIQAKYDLECVYRKYSNICLKLSTIILLLIITLFIYQRRKWIDEKQFNQKLAKSEARIQEIKTEFRSLSMEDKNIFEQETKRLGELVIEQIKYNTKLERQSKLKSKALTNAQSVLAGLQFYVLTIQGGDISQLNSKELRCLIDCYKQIDPKFINWMTQKGADLTPREMTICILFRLDKKKHEIMDMLRCSDGSFRTIKNRIKKELRICPECSNIEDFVKNMR